MTREALAAPVRTTVAGARAKPEAAKALPAGRAAGFTLVEVLVAFAVMAAAGGALLGLQAGSSRALRAAEQLHVAVALARNELALQRLLVGAESGPCSTAVAGPGWVCEVERTCAAGPLGPCALLGLRVVVGASGGREYELRGVAFPALEGLP